MFFLHTFVKKVLTNCLYSTSYTNVFMIQVFDSATRSSQPIRAKREERRREERDKQRSNNEMEVYLA